MTMTMVTTTITMAEPKSTLCWSKLLRVGFGLSFWIFLLVAIVAGGACYYWKGAEVFEQAVLGNLDLMTQTIPRMIAAVGIAGMIWVILPKDRLATYVGRYQGITGLLIAMFASIITPGGPSAAFSLLAVLKTADADRGILVTYITGWSMLGLQRMLVWDVPFMGPEFAMTRFLICLPLPIIAGLIARNIPVKLVINPAKNK